MTLIQSAPAGGESAAQKGALRASDADRTTDVSKNQPSAFEEEISRQDRDASVQSRRYERESSNSSTSGQDQDMRSSAETGSKDGADTTETSEGLREMSRSDILEETPPSKAPVIPELRVKAENGEAVVENTQSKRNIEGLFAQDSKEDSSGSTPRENTAKDALNQPVEARPKDGGQEVKRTLRGEQPVASDETRPQSEDKHALVDRKSEKVVKVSLISQSASVGGQQQKTVLNSDANIGKQGLLDKDIKAAASKQTVEAVSKSQKPTDLATSLTASTNPKPTKSEELRLERKERRSEAQFSRQSESSSHQTALKTGATQTAAQPSTQVAYTAISESQLTAITNSDGGADTQKFEFSAGGSATTSLSSTHTPQQLLPRADIPRSLAFQLQEAARNLTDQPIDVSLSPEELGRVKLSISTGEAGVVLQVLAERPETLELMRRHAELLARELSELGFVSIDLAFGQGQASEQDSDDDAPNASQTSRNSEDGTGDVDITDIDATQSLTLSDGRVDIRV